jgi:Co/Zn/Cd efflux system component
LDAEFALAVADALGRVGVPIGLVVVVWVVTCWGRLVVGVLIPPVELELAWAALGEKLRSPATATQPTRVAGTKYRAFSNLRIPYCTYLRRKRQA